MSTSNPTTSQAPRRTFQDLKAQAAGNWPYILADLAGELAPAIAANGRHVACPVHGGKDGFRLFLAPHCRPGEDFARTGGGVCNTCSREGVSTANGFGMLMWLKGWSIAEAAAAVDKWLNGEAIAPSVATRPPIKTEPEFDPEKGKAQIKRIWEGTQSVVGSVAEKYLNVRGIYAMHVPTVIRFHPNLSYWSRDPETGAFRDYGNFPALVAPLKNDRGDVVALHRIYLTADGRKAPVPEVKKNTLKWMPLNGAAIRLFSPMTVLHVGEGLESMLAVRAITRQPVWATTTAQLLQDIELPATVCRVVIWEDLDRSGRGSKAAEVLAKRVIESGRTFERCVPPGPIPEGEKGVDWLDALVRMGPSAFPDQWRYLRQAARNAA